MFVRVPRFESTARSPVNFPQAQPKTTIANPTVERRCRENLKGLGKWGDPVGDPFFFHTLEEDLSPIHKL